MRLKLLTEKGVKKKEEGKAGVHPVLLDWNQHPLR